MGRKAVRAKLERRAPQAERSVVPKIGTQWKRKKYSKADCSDDCTGLNTLKVVKLYPLNG
jgi:hypothetical protein